MINLGIKDDELKKLRALLQSPHWIDIDIQIMNTDHVKPKNNNISDRLITGQVNFDANADVTRTAEITLLDPSAQLNFNPDNPEDGALFLTTMIQVTYSVGTPMRDKWYDIPLFTGPITGMTRDDSEVTINCAGKEILGFSNYWKTKTYKKNNRLTKIIDFIVVGIMGEAAKRVKTLSSKKKNHKPVSITRESVPWKIAKQLADMLGMILFFDGLGILHLRRKSKKNAWVFNESNMVTWPKFTYDPSTVINSVVVEGKKPKGSKRKKRGTAVAPRSHPLSPAKLGRNGKGRYFTKFISDGSLKTDAACRKRARKELDRYLKESVNIEFEALPFPLMEERDGFQVRTSIANVNGTALQWAIPLDADGNASMGVIRKVSFRKGK